jgi:hypothetical protein
VSLPDGYADVSLTDALMGASVEGATMTLGAYDYRVLRRATAE